VIAKQVGTALLTAFFFSLLFDCQFLAAQQQTSCMSVSESIPCIDKIDPPGWFTQLPDPMLLVHGQGLDQVHFTLRAKGVALIKVKTSQNGHWAFLWLQTKAANAQTIQITASSPKGKIQRRFALAARSSPTNGHRGFSSADVLYLIMTDRFAKSDGADVAGENRTLPRGWHGGNLAGIQQHIDYLKELGVTTVWTTPIVSNGPMRDSYHGYAATDLYAVDRHFGTVEQYQHLSDALHSNGMKLVIDLVPNHLGVDHPWVQDLPDPEWFHGTLQSHHRAQFDFYNLVNPHAPESAWSDITNGWFTDGMPDLNQENPLVSKYLIQNALWWVETAHLDGIRLDTFPYVGRAFWHDFHAALHEAYPQLTTVGEVFHRDPEITSFFAGGATHRGIDTGLDTPFDFPTYFTLRDVLAHGKPMTALADVLRQDALYPHPERLVPFIGNHDTTRFVTDAGGSTPNLKLALGILVTIRGMPQIYSGDEIGMPGGEDPDDRHDFPGGFTGDAHSAFTTTGRTSVEEDVFSWTSKLLRMRASHPSLQNGAEQNLYADENVFAYIRTLNQTGCNPSQNASSSQDAILVVVNKAAEKKTVDIAMEGTALAGCAQFLATAEAEGNAPTRVNGKLHIEEGPQSMSIYVVR
jgi:glycosidase